MSSSLTQATQQSLKLDDVESQLEESHVLLRELNNQLEDKDRGVEELEEALEELKVGNCNWIGIIADMDGSCRVFVNISYWLTLTTKSGGCVKYHNRDVFLIAKNNKKKSQIQYRCGLLVEINKGGVIMKNLRKKNTYFCTQSGGSILYISAKIMYHKRDDYVTAKNNKKNPQSQDLPQTSVGSYHKVRCGFLIEKNKGGGSIITSDQKNNVYFCTQSGGSTLCQK